jgi:hypothetical protein
VPFTICLGCGLRVYTAAACSGIDSCPRCGARLPRRPTGYRDGLHLRYTAEAMKQLERPRRPPRSRDG